MATEHSFVHGHLAVHPWGKERFLIYRPLYQGDAAIGVVELTEPADVTLASGRFSNMTGDVYEHQVGLDIPLNYGFGPGFKGDTRIQAALDWIGSEVEGQWTLTMAERMFPASKTGLMASFDSVKINWPYPVFLFEKATDAVKFAIMCN